jgi:hypothetical protein
MLPEAMLTAEERILGELIVASDGLARCSLRADTREMRLEARRLHALIGQLLAELPE